MDQQFSLFARMGKDLPLTVLHELIRELLVGRVMTSDVLSLTSDTSMQEVKDLMREHRISGLPIVDEGELVGIVSVQDLIHALEQQALERPVADFMTANPFTVHLKEPVVEALRKLESTGVGRLLVVDDHDKLAGILTKGDIVAGLLTALQELYNEAEALQLKRRPSYFFEALESDDTSLTLRYRVHFGDFTLGGQASARIKQALLQIGATPQLARRVAIATYEAEINLIIHTDDGGSIVAEIHPTQITVIAHDAGPGIPDIELARRAGYSTASEIAREMGFGAGMGLVNINRCTDDLNIWSAVGVGTRLEMMFNVPPEEVTVKN
ncbi:MAG TPA: CBS domain-containing protein [Chloroflexi bacterium]|nr:CBS domain-containing protein [Chloroflexota bacterium]